MPDYDEQWRVWCDHYAARELYFASEGKYAADFDGITELVQSGWTMDFYVPEEYREFCNGDVITCEGELLHDALTELVATWDREETEDGGVITYRRNNSK